MKQIKNRKVTRSWKKKKRGGRLSFRIIFPKPKLSQIKFPQIKISKKPLIPTAIFVLICLCIYLAVFSDYFYIKDILITGNESIEKSKIEEIMKNELSAPKYGYIPGNSFLFIKEGEIIKKLTDNFSEIEKIGITRKFPNKIEIVIKEKNPALIWCRTDCYFINDQGIAFLHAEEQDMVNQNKHFIKVLEEKEIAEEVQEGSPSDSISNPISDTTQSATAASESNAPEITRIQFEKNLESQTENADKLTDKTVRSSAISKDEKVSDENFVRFTVEINNRIGYNPKLKIKYYKTKGTKTRELIAFTDKNTRIYFDTTQNAQKQANNLAEFLEKGVEKDKIDSIKYIYLKNDDRIFYK